MMIGVDCCCGEIIAEGSCEDTVRQRPVSQLGKMYGWRVRGHVAVPMAGADLTLTSVSQQDFREEVSSYLVYN